MLVILLLFILIPPVAIIVLDRIFSRMDR